MIKILMAAKPQSNNSHAEVIGPWISPVAKATILDVGCGGGHFLRGAALKGFSVYGVDADRRMVVETRKKLEGINDAAKHVLQTLVGAPLPGMWPKFDYITSFECLEHSENPRQMLIWVLDALKHDGWFICSVPESPQTKLSSSALLAELPKDNEDLVGINKHKCCFEEYGLQELLLDVGFKDVEVTKVSKGTKQRLLARGKKWTL